MGISAISRACGILGGAAALAKQLGVTVGAVYQWKAGARPVPIERCVEIERITDGAVSRIHLRPSDWHRIWPELAAAHPDRVPPSIRPSGALT